MDVRCLLFVSFLLPCVSFGYTFGTNTTCVSTEIFGYDRVTPPSPGKALRTDAFVTITNAVSDKSFRLYDLRVVGYAATGETAGTFNLYAPVKDAKGRMVPEKDAFGRDLAFYWFDDGDHAAGWYDTNGTSRWENVVFSPGQAFCVQGGGLVLETNGLVLDSSVDRPVPPNTNVAIGTPWAKRTNLADIALPGNGTNNVAGGITLQTLKPDLSRKAVYYWFCVTNEISATHPAYRTPGWYLSNTNHTPITAADNITFDMGEAFWMQGYQSNPGEPAPEVRFQMAPMQLQLKEEK